MRIRKHAKISPLFYASSSLKPGTVFQTHVCQLNQSPWDVITFPPPDPSVLPPPPPFLVDKDHSYLANGFFSDHIAADESPAAKEERNDIVAGEGFDNRGTEFGQEQSVNLKREEEDNNILRCKIDGKGLQCTKKSRNGQAFSEHYNLAAQPPVKKSESRYRARSKKPASSSNPHEFYYYSGFGPRWGKKRGAGACSARKEEPYTSHDSSSSIEVDAVTAAEGPNTPEPSVKSSSFTPQFDKEVLDYDDDFEEDYDDDNDDDDDNLETGRKRARKPIKARSLKSLM